MGNESRDERRARTREQRANDETRPVLTAVPGAALPAPGAVSEPQWSAWAVLATPRGWLRVRMVLPESVVLAHAVGEVSAPDTRASMVAQVTRDLVSDRLVDRRGWEKGR